MTACVSVSALQRNATVISSHTPDTISDPLTDLLLALEYIQPPVLCRFPRLRRFMVFQHDTRHVRRPGLGCLFRCHPDGIAFRREEARVCEIRLGRRLGSFWWMLKQSLRLSLVIFRLPQDSRCPPYRPPRRTSAYRDPSPRAYRPLCTDHLVDAYRTCVYLPRGHPRRIDPQALIRIRCPACEESRTVYDACRAAVSVSVSGSVAKACCLREGGNQIRDREHRKPLSTAETPISDRALSRARCKQPRY